jgi:membrane fusion protein, multidrug efflux system
VQFLSAKNNKESLENKIKTLKESIDMYKITAPISGTVEDAPLKVGQSMAPGLVAYRIINFSRVKVICDVSESYATRIKKGNEVKVSFPDDNKEFDSKIDFTS